MRSRFSAYALGLSDYLIKPTHPKNPDRKPNLMQWRKDLSLFSKSTEFRGLTIIEFSDGKDEAFVCFTAHWVQSGRDATFTERSRFLKVKDRWLYESGKVQTIL